MEWIVRILQGLVIGVSNIIPGVSGGTVAYMIGIYERLLESISDIIPNKNNKRLEYIKFLGCIGIGAVLGIVLFAKMFNYILDNPVLTQHLFLFIIGTILGSVYFMIKTNTNMKPTTNRVIILGVSILSFWVISQIAMESRDKTPEVVGTIFGFIKITEINLGYYSWLMFIGALVGASMILPGFSGSALLLSFGEYENVLMFVEEMMAVPLGFMAIGVAIGVLLFSKVLVVLLKKYEGETNYLIIGLMISSIIKLLSDLNGNVTVNQLPISILLLVVGYLIARLISTSDKKK